MASGWRKRSGETAVGMKMQRERYQRDIATRAPIRTDVIKRNKDKAEKRRSGREPRVAERGYT